MKGSRFGGLFRFGDRRREAAKLEDKEKPLVGVEVPVLLRQTVRQDSDLSLEKTQLVPSLHLTDIPTITTPASLLSPIKAEQNTFITPADPLPLADHAASFPSLRPFPSNYALGPPLGQAASHSHSIDMSTSLQLPAVSGVSKKDLRWETAAFMHAYPRYSETGKLDDVRRKFYSRLDHSGGVYLDYTGAGLYPSHLITEHAALLADGVFGNPHSHSPASMLSTVYEQQARAAILHFLDADPVEYDVIFTANATAALKIVGECYPFEGRRLMMMSDAHSSVNGIGPLARAAGGTVEFIEMDAEDCRVRETDLMVGCTFAHKDVSKDQTQLASACSSNSHSPGLVIFTGQSNVTGSKAKSSWLTSAGNNGWHVALDAAALAPTTPISLRTTPVDFLALSVYKIVGYPTGIGALVVAKRTLPILRRKSFWGGTINALHLQSLEFEIREGHAGYEDGTINFLSLPAVAPGLAFVRPLLPFVQIRTECLIHYLWTELSIITFDDPQRTRMIRPRGPPPGPDRGGALSLIFYKPEEKVPSIEHYAFIVYAASKRGISIRGAPCLCNHGGTSAILGYGPDTQITPDSEIGYVRVSVGLVSNFEDCYRFTEFCRSLAVLSKYRQERQAWLDGFSYVH